MGSKRLQWEYGLIGIYEIPLAAFEQKFQKEEGKE
jgi:hypothetical protein